MPSPVIPHQTTCDGLEPTMCLGTSGISDYFAHCWIGLARALIVQDFATYGAKTLQHAKAGVLTAVISDGHRLYAL